jgi:hypothetical protein
MEHLSEERIAEIREDGMRLSDFRIGMEFWMSGARWRCTDIGTRLVIAIKLDHDDDPSWYDGPPYAVCEHTIDRHDFTACSLTRYDGNSESYSDEEVERIRNSGKTDIVEQKAFLRCWSVSRHRAPMRPEKARFKWTVLIKSK